MSKVIIFCGLPASGKTTLAAEVSKRLDIFCLHKDALKERLYELLGGKSLEDSRKIGRAVIEMILALGEDALQSGIDVILESPFNHPDNPKRFAAWQKKYDAELLVVVCSIHEKERERRHKMRVRHHGHHDQERLHQYPFHTDIFDYSVMPGKKLILDTCEPIPVLVKKVLEFVQ